MFVQYEDDDVYPQEQIARNRQALIFIFLLMVGIVFLGDQQDQAPQQRGRNKRVQHRLPHNYPYLTPFTSFDGTVVFDPSIFLERNNDLYGFRVISPPGIWSITDSQFGDVNMIAHNTLDRPMLMLPTMQDIYHCSWKDHDNMCYRVSGVPETFSFTSPIDASIEDNVDYSMKTATDCPEECKKGYTCRQLVRETVDAIGSPSCYPDLLGASTAVALSSDVLFYYSVSSEDFFKKTMEKKVECISQQSREIKKAETNEDEGNFGIGFSEVDAVWTRRSSISHGDFFPMCATRIDVKALEAGNSDGIVTECQSYTSYRLPANPTVVQAMNRQVVTIGFNSLGNLVVSAFASFEIEDLETFKHVYSGSNGRSLNKKDNDNCEPPNDTGPKVVYAISFSGLKSGWFFPSSISDSDHKKDKANLMIVGDGGQWYCSRIVMDLEFGVYEEEIIYQGR